MAAVTDQAVALARVVREPAVALVLRDQDRQEAQVPAVRVRGEEPEAAVPDQALAGQAPEAAQRQVSYHSCTRRARTQLLDTG